MQIECDDFAATSTADFAVEAMEELDAPGFMDGFAAGVGIVGGIAGAVALT
ncbi:hypothetical protein ACFYM2_26040 [Streptomyces sp. NPDC006711]|uniref:hypothetical protein n=1 Tax=unclassified Streptomyces TaxID=2593676 RepID=UPI0033F6AC90